MTNPYAPPSTKEVTPQAPSNNHTTLRRIGTIALACQLGRALWRNFATLQVSDLIFSASISITLSGILIYCFLRKGWKFHLGFSLFLALSIASQAYDEWYVGLPPQPGALNPWLSFAIEISPLAVACICAAAIYFRTRRDPSLA